jgi:hypothetical protein
VFWKQWGPYLSERQWGTVREDYSENGDAWNYFTHDQARSRAYHWGEDGLAGFSDDHQRLCFALALWNGKDPILKERLFGLTNSEGKHGEDVNAIVRRMCSRVSSGSRSGCGGAELPSDRRNRRGASDRDNLGAAPLRAAVKAKPCQGSPGSGISNW